MDKLLPDYIIVTVPSLKFHSRYSEFYESPSLSSTAIIPHSDHLIINPELEPYSTLTQHKDDGLFPAKEDGFHFQSA